MTTLTHIVEAKTAETYELMDAHVNAYYVDIEAYGDAIEAAAMQAAEDRWVDAGCPSNGFYDDGFYD